MERPLLCLILIDTLNFEVEIPIMNQDLLKPRRLAVALLKTLKEGEGTIARLLRGLPELSATDRGFLSEIVYGVARHEGYLQFVLQKKLKKPLRKLPPDFLLALEVALYQLLFLDKVPAYAIIWEAVESVKARYGAPMARLGNAVLRGVEREIDKWRWKPLNGEVEADDSLAAHYSMPIWLIKRYRALFAQSELLALLSFLNERPAQVLRFNRRKGGVCAVSEGKIDRHHPLYQEGRLSFQSLSSQLVAELVASLVRPGDRLIDVCAGAGGKIFALAEVLGEKARYAAYDIKRESREDCARERERLGLPEVEVVDFIPDEKFNVVLVDAPCSGLGTLQKAPELKWRRSEAELEKFGAEQLKILEFYAPLVAEKGILFYSVCSTEPEENEQVIEKFLVAHPEFEIHSPALPPACKAFTPVTSGFKLYPHRVQSEGFFVSVMRRRKTE